MNIDFGSLVDKYGVAVAMLTVLVVERYTIMKGILRLLNRIEKHLDDHGKRDTDRIDRGL